MSKNNPKSKRTARSVMEWLGYLYPDELDTLQSIATTLPENPHVVNIGAGGGTSGLAFLESRPDLSLTTVDIQDKSSPFGCLEAELKMIEEAGLLDSGRYRQIHGDSKFAGLKWENDLVDMVFIDGDHSYEGCSGDIRAWLENLKEGGIIAVHDYGKKEKAFPGVDKAVNELLSDNYQHIITVESLIVFQKTNIDK